MYKYFLILSLFILILTGCSNEVIDTSDYIMIPKDELPRLWQGADTQLWDFTSDFSLSEENGWERGVTNWQDWKGEFDQSLATPNQIWETPGMLMQAWMDDVTFSYWLGQEIWEVTKRIELHNEELAEGYILSYGMKDDSIAGNDVKVTMKQANGYWYIEAIDIRYRCSRNVSEDNELCV